MHILKILTIIVSVFTITALCTISSPSYAQNNGQAQECTKADEKKIRGFNKKIKRKQTERESLQKDAGKHSGIGGSLKYKRKMQEIDSFFSSKEYRNMEPVYARCNVEMPR